MRYHVCQSVRGVLRMSKPELRRYARGCLQDGKPMTAEEVLSFFMDQLAMGHEVYPMGECDRFDWKKGCLGHPIPAEHPDASLERDRQPAPAEVSDGR